MKTQALHPRSFPQALVLGAALFAVACIPSCAHAQAAGGPTQVATSPLYAGLQGAFDLNDTNSLVNANEVNITPFAKWNSKESLFGGGVNADWWVTDQQGAFIGFEEYSNRKSYFSFGYGARTVFKGAEIALQFGTRQDSDDPFGQVELFIRPSLSVRVVNTESFDLRISVGADITNGGKPNPFVGLTARLFKF